MSGAGRDEMSLASAEAKRWESDEADFADAATAWFNGRWKELFDAGHGGDAILGLYADHLQAEADASERKRLAEENQRLRADLAETVGKLQRLRAVTDQLIVAQNALDILDRQTKETER